MNAFWIILALIGAASLIPVLIAVSLIYGLKDAEKQQEELKRYPSLRRLKGFEVACGLPYMVGCVPVICESIGLHCPRSVWLAGGVLQVASLVAILWIGKVQKRERERLRRQENEATGEPC